MDKKRSVYVGQCIDLVGGDASNNYVTNMWHAKALLLFVCVVGKFSLSTLTVTDFSPKGV